MKKFVFPGVVILVCLVALVRTMAADPAPIRFSGPVSHVVIALLGLAMLGVLALTARGIYVERRWVFVFVGVALVLPYFMDIVVTPRKSPEVQELVQAIENLPPGSRVLVSFDFDPPSAPELQPMADSFMAYAFKHDLKVIIIGLWPQGPQQANLAITRAMLQPEVAAKHPEYGVDYVNLGFQSGNEFVIQSMGSSFRSMFPRDSRNTPYDQVPLLNGIENFNNIDFVVNFSAGYPGTKEWVQIAVDRFQARVGAGNTAVQAPEMYPYLNARQLVGLAGGMTGAAEFETSLGERGRASVALLSQLFAHAVVVGFIVIGNVALFLDRPAEGGTLMHHTLGDIVGIWIGAFCTLGILSFLYKDNILYKIAEAVFIGISAGYWFITYYWDNIYKKAWQGIVYEHHYYLVVGVILGILMLMRLVGSIGWIARWPIAFIVGATAGLKLIVFLATDALAQVGATVANLSTSGGAANLVGQIVVAGGTFAALVYFFFSREHKGAFGATAKFGTWILMVTFGASFGYTVMSRMSLLIGRVDFLLTDWLRLVR